MLCILFDPDEPASLAFAEDKCKKLAPESIPRVVIAFKPSIKASDADNSSSDLATEAMLKQFPASFLCDSESKVPDAVALLVRTALRPYVLTVLLWCIADLLTGCVCTRSADAVVVCLVLFTATATVAAITLVQRTRAASTAARLA